jgi:hypothetical protein
MPFIGNIKNFQSFTMTYRKLHFASFICLRHNFSKPRRDFVDTLYYFHAYTLQLNGYLAVRRMPSRSLERDNCSAVQKCLPS